MKTLLIDNYDSFTYNLYHYLQSLNCNVDVIRNDKITTQEIIRKIIKKLLFRLGLRNPNQAGNCLKIVKDFYQKKTYPGCLSWHQVIGQAFEQNYKCKKAYAWKDQ